MRYGRINAVRAILPVLAVNFDLILPVTENNRFRESIYLVRNRGFVVLG